MDLKEQCSSFEGKDLLAGWDSQIVLIGVILSTNCMVLLIPVPGWMTDQPNDWQLVADCQTGQTV